MAVMEKCQSEATPEGEVGLVSGIACISETLAIEMLGQSSFGSFQP